MGRRYCCRSAAKYLNYNSATMSSVECLREFFNERLTAVAEEIFRVFIKTIVEYEEEIDRQRKLLDIVLKPEIKLRRIELPQQHVSREEEVPADQQLCNQEKNSGHGQEDPDPPQIKEEQENLCTSQQEEQLVLKQETDAFMLTDTCVGSDHSQDQTVCLNHDLTQGAAEEEPVVNISVKNFVVSEPNTDHQLLSNNSHVAESQDQKGGKHGDSGSTGDAESEPKKSNNLNNPTMSKNLKKSFKCNTCGKDCKFKSKLQSHLRSHTGEKPYSCKICGKKYRGTTGLKVHMRIHTGEKPYCCDTCGKRFNQTSALNAHIRIHTGEKPFSCKTCGRNFICSSGLIRHMRTHTGEKPYLCKLCGTRFGDKSVLENHKRIHTGEKPHTCSICGKAFRLFSILKNHVIRTHTGEKAYD